MRIPTPAKAKSEPALVSGLVAAVVALGASFGLNLSADQIGAVMVAVSAGLAFVTRSQVMPLVKVIPHVDAPTIAPVPLDVPAEVPTPISQDPTPPPAPIVPPPSVQ